MSLLEDLQQERNRVSPDCGVCRVCRWLDTQSPEIIVDIEQWILDRLPKKNLWRICVRNGLDCAETSMRRHIEHFLEDRNGDS